VSEPSLADAIVEDAAAELLSRGIPDSQRIAERILRRIQESGWGAASHYLHAAPRQDLPEPSPSAPRGARQVRSRGISWSRSNYRCL